MTEFELALEMNHLARISDFMIIFKNECHSEYHGLYYANHKLAVIYLLEEDGTRISDYQLIKTAIHELTHHVLYHYSKWESNGKNEHDLAFKELFSAMLKKYYNYDIPQGVLDLLKEEEMYEER